MTPSPSLRAAIAEICAWHNRTALLHPMRTLPSGRREPILPPEIPDAIRLGEIEVPEEIVRKIQELRAIASHEDPPQSVWRLGDFTNARLREGGS